jgi:predicted RNA-binding Zn ribbon-like protein
VGSSGPPRTADGSTFRFRAGRPSLDLCSTLLWRHLAPVEQLRHPDDLSRWLVAAKLAPTPPAVSDEELTRARSLREDAYHLFHAQLADDPLPAGQIGTVNAAAANPDRAPQLINGGQLGWVTDQPVSAALATVARDAIDLLTGPLAGRFRECAAPNCAFLFVDTSRPGTRRWCAMNRCGNRQHLRDHRSRRAMACQT